MSQELKSNKTRIFAITAGTNSQSVSKANAKRKYLEVRVLGSDVVYITSQQNSPYSQGIPVGIYTPFRTAESQSELWIITSSGSVTAYVSEVME